MELCTRGRRARRALTVAWATATALTAFGCAPPPPVALGDTAAEGPTLEILYPEQGQVIQLDSSCVLTELLVVHVTGIELVEPNGELVEGQGHWHGGPNLDQGYCLAEVPFCAGAPSSDSYESYDGSGMKAGSLTLHAKLQDNLHGDIGPDVHVEVQLEDPTGDCSGTSGQ